MSDSFQHILSESRAAVEQYNMLPPGTRLAVGVSGGKDSLMLLCVCAALRDILGNIEVTAVTIDPCFSKEKGDYTGVAALCRKLGIPYVVKETHLYEVIFEERQEKNPCSLCARMRRGILHTAAVEAGCDTLALGHHKQDVAETVLMNLLDGGTFGCFAPKAFLDRRGLTLIRPMIFVDEEEIRRAAARMTLPVVPSLCPVDGCTHRRETRELLETLSETYGPVDDKLITALKKGGVNGW